MYGVTEAGRRAAESRMLSTCTVRRRTSLTIQDEATGEEVPVWAVVYTGPFRLGGSRNAATTRAEDIAGVEVQRALRIAHFPSAADVFADGDLVDVTAGENAGAVLRIVEADWQDQATARRYPVESTERPGEW